MRIRTYHHQLSFRGRPQRVISLPCINKATGLSSTTGRTKSRESILTISKRKRWLNKGGCVTSISLIRSIR